MDASIEAKKLFLPRDMTMAIITIPFTRQQWVWHQNQNILNTLNIDNIFDGLIVDSEINKISWKSFEVYVNKLTTFKRKNKVDL